MLLNKYIKYTFLATTITTLLTACAGSDGSNNSSTAPFTSKPISGAAVDFYLKNATVKFDDCNDVTTTTGEQGNSLLIPLPTVITPQLPSLGVQI